MVQATGRVQDMKRREFLGVLATVAAGRWLARGQSPAAAPGLALELGACRPLEQAAVLQQAGLAYVEESVQHFLLPDRPDAEFVPHLEKLQRAALPIRACNGFFPADLKLVGPAADPPRALQYGRTAVARAGQARIGLLVLGSGKSRAVPAGFEPARAREQFIRLCRQLGPLAREHGVTVALEPLNRGETNLLNSVAEGVEFVDAIGDAGIQLLADFYHMAREHEDPDVIRKAGRRLRHCHVSEANRAPPGTTGQDFRPYFRALQAIGYTGRLSLECRWVKLVPELVRARAALMEQMQSL